jgi:hypothetical protein
MPSGVQKKEKSAKGDIPSGINLYPKKKTEI